MLALAEFLTSDRVVLLSATTKAEALDELMDVIVACNGGVEKESLAREIAKREEMMSTGIGNKLAIPHVRMEGINRATMAVGVSRDGLADYESLDKQPVHIIVMIAAAKGEHETYIRLLAQVAEALKEADLREEIIRATDPAEIHRIFIEGQA